MHPYQPTDAELNILQVLWSLGPSSVREVNEQLNAQRSETEKEIGYTTTLKHLQIMSEKKGLVERRSEGRKHIYIAKVKESATQNQLLSKFLDSAFKGSAAKLVLQALGNHEASREELDEIKALIKRIEDQE